ncbi:MAG: DASS family sodium-coupled anion symporter [Hyphomicrobiaceae bacterium]
MSTEQADGAIVRQAGLLLGASAFVVLILLPPPSGLPDKAWSVTALAVLMAAWWLTEAVPLAATALLPIVLLPLLGIRTIDDAATAYANPLVFLFLGGFIVARGLERWSLHRRIAMLIIGLAPSGSGGLVAALMLATAFLSMWISNTAAAMVMLPIATAVSGAGRGPKDLEAALVLAVAFAATIGGMGTIIGTPPNALLVGYLERVHDVSIGFGQWMLLGLPVVLCLLPAGWLLLTRLAFDLRESAARPEPSATALGLAGTGRLASGALRTAVIATLAGLALVVRPYADSFLPIPMGDAGIAMTAALLLMIVPAGGLASERLVDWACVSTIRWDVLILFGGGLALADSIDATGLSQAIGSTVSELDALPVAAVVLIAMAAMVYLGELASNTAMAAVFIPIAGAAAPALGVSVSELAIPIGLAASLGFMLPVATPPNAIAYGTGKVTGQQMLKAGALFDVVSILIVFAMAQLLVPLLVR